MKVMEEREFHVRLAKKERNVSYKYDVKNVRSVEEGIYTRELPVSSSGKTYFVLMAGGLLTPFQTAREPSLITPKGSLPVPCSWG